MYLRIYEIESHVRCLDSLNGKSNSYGTACSNDYDKVTTSIKACCKPSPKIVTVGLAELVNLMNTETKARANCGEYNFSQGNEFDHLDLRTTSALASQASESISKKCVFVSNKCVFCLGQHWSDNVT